MEIQEYRTYQEYKKELDTELNRTAEGFVRIGYLLKVARDTEILKESGYGNVVDFAKAEYGIDKTQVSRFISINDRFSEGGYSDRLKEGYQKFGYAKLTLMLQLPEAINEELSPDFSKAEIQAIKDEVDAEREITDIEVAIEAAEAAGAGKPVAAPEGTVLERTLWQLFREQKELFRKVWDICRTERTTQEIMDILAPQGEALYSVRIPGTGKLQLILNGAGSSIVNVRTMEKTRYEKEELAGAVQNFARQGISPEEVYQELYGEELEQKAEVAPVQQAEEAKKATARKESRVITAPKPEKKAEPERKKQEAQETERNEAYRRPEVWESEYKTGDIVMDTMSSAIGVLLEKTGKTGIWHFKPTAPEGDSYNLSESYFTRKEKKQAEEPGPAAGTEQIPAEQSGAQEEMQVPGQTDIETDFPEYMPPTMPPELIAEQRKGYMNLLRDAAESLVRCADMGLWKSARQQVSEIVKHLAELERLPEVEDE